MTPLEEAERLMEAEYLQMDAEAKEARERRAVRHARIAVACWVAAFWIAVFAGGAWAWAETVSGGVR